MSIKRFLEIDKCTKMIKDFVIPVTKDELLQARNGQYFVEKIIPTQMIPQALNGI